MTVTRLGKRIKHREQSFPIETAFPTDMPVISRGSGWEVEKLSNTCDGQIGHQENLESKSKRQEGLWRIS